MTLEIPSEGIWSYLHTWVTGISPEKAKCSNVVATTPKGDRDMSKVAKVRSIFLALASDIVHAAKQCPFSVVTTSLLLPKV